MESMDVDIEDCLRELNNSSSFLPKSVNDNNNSNGPSRKRAERDPTNDQDDLDLIAQMWEAAQEPNSEPPSVNSLNPNPKKRFRRALNFDADERDENFTDITNLNDNGLENWLRKRRGQSQDPNSQGSSNVNDITHLTIPPASAPAKEPNYTTAIASTRNTQEISMTDNEEEIVVRYRHVLKLIPTVPYVGITCPNGSRVYLRLLPDDDKFVIKKQDSLSNLFDQEEEAPKMHRRGLLGLDPELKRQAMAEEESNSDIAMDDFNNIGIGTNEVRTLDEDLWVEKYKPKKYMDLLSEESINHTLLHWLKLWDKSVFGTDYLAKLRFLKEKYSTLEAKEKEKADKWKKVMIEDDGYDELGRPMQKVVLIHGPPGLGKTTAAHVICKHAGYNVIELNASDDRSVEVFKKSLDATTGSRSEMFQDGRPNCLVIDEIDGAPLATVSVLVDLITGKSTESGKNKNKKILRRPVICICNELFAPSLKNLKKLALLIPFQPISVASLAERLKEISMKENLSLDQSTLYGLAEKTDCDVRSSVLCIQFMKGKICEGPKERDKILEQIGVQDKTKGVFDVWKDIFQLPEGKPSYRSKEDKDPLRPDLRFTNMLRSAQNNGEYDKLFDGVFENYLKADFRDSYFESIIQGLEWIHWFEELKDFINHEQNYSLYPFLPFFFVASHFLFAGKNRLQIQYPTNEANLKHKNLINTIKDQIMDMIPSVGRFVDVTSLTLDIFPNLVSIIQPSTIRQIPTQLWSQKERELVKVVVNIMIAYNLTYIQQRSLEGLYTFTMDPNIEDLTTFKVEDASTRRNYFHAIRQLIAREIETERLRRSDLNTAEITSATNNDELPQPKVAAPIVKPKDTRSTSCILGAVTKPAFKVESKDLTVTKEKDRPKQINLMNYFGVKIIPKKIKDEEGNWVEQPKKIEIPPPDIYYVYKCGYTNAVRKYLKVRDLL